MAVLVTIRRCRSTKTMKSTIRPCKHARIWVLLFLGSNSKLIPKNMNLVTQPVALFGGGSVHRRVCTYTGQHMYTHIHALWDSNPRT
jgi:uncharacterized membrane-anchored protein